MLYAREKSHLLILYGRIEGGDWGYKSPFLVENFLNVYLDRGMSRTVLQIRRNFISKRGRKPAKPSSPSNVADSRTRVG